jgi:DNA-binding winged helix-turn-helix (wHTH) protein/tetratricopeptide (TPR) repeat protein
MTKTIIKFDDFIINSEENSLSKKGELLSLPQKALSLLTLLAANSAKIIPSEILLKEVWKENAASKSVLLVNITTIRNILGKQPNGLDYIVNKPRQGYYFAGEISFETEKTAINDSYNKLSFNHFVGRENEMDLLKLEYQKLQNGIGNSILIQGEAGIGKTTLIQEFIKEVSAENVFIKHFFHYLADKTPLYEVYFSMLWAVLNKNNTGYSYQKLAASLSEKFGIVLPQESTQFIGKGKDLFVRLIAKVFEEMSKTEPLILIFDDVHFAEIGDLEVLENLINLSKENSILLILSARGEKEAGVSPCYPNWIRSQYAINRLNEINLKLLGKSDCEHLIARIFGGKDISPEIPPTDFKILLLMVKGNPYFLIEMIRWLLKERRIYLTAEFGTKWVWRKSNEFSIPDSLTEIVRVKIKRLASETIEILEKAGVYGDTFDIKEIGEMFSADIETVEKAFEEAVLNGILTRNFTNEKEFRFSHFIQRQIIYESIRVTEKEAIHRQIAEYLVGNVEKNIETVIKICHHFEFAKIEKDAFSWNVEAGKLLFNRNNCKEACLHFDRAIKLSAKTELDEFGFFDLNFKKTYCLVILERADEAISELNNLDKAAEKLSSKVYQADVLFLRGRIMLYFSKYREASKMFDKVLEIYRKNNLSEKTETVLHFKIVLFIRFGKYNEVIKMKNEILAKNAEPSHLKVLMSNFLAVSFIFLNETETAKPILESNLIFLKGNADFHLKSSTQNNLGRVYIYEGKYERAIGLIIEAKKNAKDAGLKIAVHEAEYLFCLAKTSQGLYEEVLPKLLTLRQVFIDLEIPHLEAETLCLLGQSYLGLGEEAKARRVLKDGLKLIRQVGDKDDEFRILLKLCELANFQKDFEKMLEYSVEAHKIASEINNPRGIGLSLAETAVASAEQKQHQNAMQKAEEAVKILGNSTIAERWRVFYALGKVIMINQKHKPYNDSALIKKAEKALLEAVEILDDIRAELDLDNAENLLRYSQMTKALSAPATELHKLWQKAGETKKARLLAKEWFLKV